MGQIAKQVSEHTTRYYWYPGEKQDWLRALVALGSGLGVFSVAYMVTRSMLVATVSGTSVIAVVAGVNFGRRDARALVGLPDAGGRIARRDVVAVTGRAAWRAVVEGAGAAVAAVLIVNLPAAGVAADWLLPLVPTVAGALAHQAGMLSERLTHESAPASSLRPVLKPTPKQA